METRANYIIVGLFTIAMIVAGLGFIYWTYGVTDQGETVQMRVRIPGSASGLGRGSAVLFNGVKVGDVRRVYIDVNNPEVAIADTMVDQFTPITQSTKADIGLAGLTGTANVELTGANTSEPNILAEASKNGTVAVITANPSAVTNLLQTAQSILTRADTVVGQLEGFVGDARGPLTDTVGNVRKFSDALSSNADGIDKFLVSVGNLSDTLNGVSGQLTGTLAKADNILGAVDPDRIGSIVDNVDDFSQALSRNADGIDTLLQQVGGLSETIQSASQSLDSTLAGADELIKSVDRDKIASVVSNVERFSQVLSTNADGIDQFVANVNALTGKIEGVSEQMSTTLASADNLINSVDRDKITTIVANVEQLTANARTATAGLDEIMASVDNTVKSIGGLSDNAKGTLASADELINSVDREKIAGVVANVERFSKVLSDNAEDVDRVVGKIDGISDQVSTTLSSAQNLINSVDRAKVTTILANVEEFTGNARAATAGLDGIVANVDTVVKSIGSVSASADDILAGVDAATIRSALSNFEQASVTANNAVNDVSKVTARIGERGDDIDAFIGNARQLAERLNQASVRVDGVLAKVDSLLGSENTESLITDASETMKSFRQVADTLNARIGTITDGFSRFSGQGLRDIEALIKDSRRAVNRIEGAITSIERNPQRILTGGDGEVRQYDGRTRR